MLVGKKLKVSFPMRKFEVCEKVNVKGEKIWGRGEIDEKN